MYRYLFALLFFIHLKIYPQQLTAKDIIAYSDQLMRGNTLRGRYRMTVIRPKWRRTLELIAYAKGKEKTFIKIIAPAKEKGITTLRIKNNMWIYHPQVERIIKIPPSMMLQPWMGSDFTNDDLVKESSIVDDYTHKILYEKTVDGEKVYVIELLPKREAGVVWSKLIFWIRKKDFIPLREEYYDEKGRLVKVLSYSKIKQFSDRKIPSLWTMSSKIKPNHKTIIEVIEALYNQPLDENIFSLKNLKR